LKTFGLSSFILRKVGTRVFSYIKIGLKTLEFWRKINEKV
jgi:hypothetical protein